MPGLFSSIRDWLPGALDNGFYESGRRKMSRFVLSDPQLPARQSLAPRLNADVHLQMQSPLFSAIPAEVRNRIFAIALTAYDDTSKPYQPQNWFYRPDWHFHPKISTTLLRTCKRIYLECHLLPLVLNSHTFWLSVQRAPPFHYFPGASKKALPSSRGNRTRGNWNASENFRGFFNRLTAEQRAAVGELHFFLQQYCLEDVKFSPPLDPESSRPVAAQRLKVTIRHQDWYYWEHDERLGLCPWNRGRTMWNGMDTPMPRTRMERVASLGWGAQLQYIEGLEEFELEMETLVEKKGQMDGIVERAKRWIFPLKGDRVLRWDRGTGVKESRWEEDDLPLNCNVPEPDSSLPPPVSNVNPTMLVRSGAAQSNAREDSLVRTGVGAQQTLPPQSPDPALSKRHYYVVSLTWTVQKGGEEEHEEEFPPGQEMAVQWKPMAR